jgi:hypothetical protein
MACLGSFRLFCLFFLIGGKFCFRSKTFSFVLGYATGIIRNVGRGRIVSFLLRHRGVNIAPAYHLRQCPSVP